ncbi:hypothetical protein Rhopal_000598-T1 [Rhodotorula paludigena]|uniref:tRNA-dihydrouridine(16/17) synthase [NAD(P)(+)] n=1 Tax=Rhodotorula paludigena TaxID=86838 RepID=A0AAV5GC43_9BASI|nr:hypothetical protein Rhopal_000598-T1 [Rhodotorula paludigena]
MTVSAPALAPSAAQQALEDEKYTVPPTTATLEPQPASQHVKLEGHALWKSMGEPKYIVAPMVDQSELAWRILSRVHGANLCYTPMFHAALFATQPKYQPEMFDLSPDSLEGVAPYDRPLVVQFCANDKDQFLAAAKKVEGRCDAVDLNLGCPQGIAKRGHYGAFLMEHWDLIRSLISNLHENLSTPIIAKLRVFPSLSKTLHYASHVYSSGAQLLTIHGRTREAKGQQAGFASWSKIKSVVDLISPKVPVLANGGCPSAEEIGPCLEETGAYGVMSAEGNLYNPMIFAPHNAAEGRAYTAQLPDAMRAALLAAENELDLGGAGWDRDAAAYAPCTFIAQQYLAIVRTLPSTRTATSAIKAHLYKLFRPIWAAGRYGEMRESLGKAGGGSGSGLTHEERVAQFQAWVDDFREKIKADRAAGLLPPDSNRPLTHAEVQTLFGGVIPYSHCQPYLRVTKPQDAKNEDELFKVDGEAKRKREVEEATVTDPDAPVTQRHKPSPPSPSSTPSLTLPTSYHAGLAHSTSLADGHAPAPSAAPASVACAGSGAAQEGEGDKCVNAAAAKCALGACKSCCAARRAGAEESTGCEFHEDKERKAGERDARKKEAQRVRRAAGEKKARENEARLKVERERKRAEREEKKQKEEEEKGGKEVVVPKETEGQ